MLVAAGQTIQARCSRIYLTGIALREGKGKIVRQKFRHVVERAKEDRVTKMLCCLSSALPHIHGLTPNLTSSSREKSEMNET